MATLPVRTSILGTEVSATSYGEVLRLCRDWIEHGREPDASGHMICVACVHSLMAAVRRPELRQTYNASDITTPDGMPLVWALRSSGFDRQQRVYGPNLMLALCGQAARLGHGVYLYGGTEERLRDLEGRLKSRFPSLRISGSEAPPFRPLSAEEEAAAVERIRTSGADLVFVGLGAPKQEAFMKRNRDLLPGRVLIGVGAAFDFHAGVVRQAPLWVQRSGLEWFFRLAMEPKRLWKRYLLVTPWFIPLYALQRLGVLKYPTSDREAKCVS